MIKDVLNGKNILSVGAATVFCGAALYAGADRAREGKGTRSGGMHGRRERRRGMQRRGMMR